MKHPNVLFALCILVFSFQISSSVLCQQLNWTGTLGPLNGAVNAIYGNGSSIYVGTANGLFYSSDGGTHWDYSPLPHASVQSFCAAGSDILVGAFAGGIYRGIALNWQSSQQGLGNLNVWSLTLFKNVLYAATSSGVYRSTDNGHTWSLADSGLPPNPVNCLASSNSTLFAGTTGGLYRFEEGSSTWIRSDSGVGNFVIKCIVNSDSGIFVGTNAGVYRSTNDGVRWASANTGLAGQSIRALARNSNFLFTTTNKGVYRTSNGGNTWSASSISSADSNTTALWVSNATVFAGTISNGLFVSSDNGSSWTKVAVAASVTRAVCTFSTTVFCGSFLGVQRSTDHGSTWTQTILNNSTVLALAHNSTQVFAGTPSLGVYRSDDFGTSWLRVNSGLSDTNVRCLLFDGSTLYAGTKSGVSWSSNNGDSWQSSQSGLPLTNVNAMASLNNVVVAATSNKGLYRSFDGAKTWSACTTNVSDTTMMSVVAANGKFYAGSNTGTIYMSADGGLNWTHFAVQLNRAKLLRSLTSVGSYLIVGSDSTRLTMTNNDGTTWIDAGLPANTVYAFAQENTTLYAATYGSGVYRCDATALPVQSDFTDLSRDWLRFNIDIHSNTMQVHSDQCALREIALLNACGQLVYTTNGLNCYDYDIALACVQTGWYLLQVRSTEGVCVRKIIIER